MDASDWIRLKRLKGARLNMDHSPPPPSRGDPVFNDSTNPYPRIEVKTGRRVYTEVGGSKIRRPASNFTDYIASQIVDYVLEYPSGECGVARALTINKLCTCDTSSAIKHNGLCRTCTHDRIQTNPNNNTVEVRLVFTSLGQSITVTLQQNTIYTFVNNSGNVIRVVESDSQFGPCLDDGESVSTDPVPPEADGLILTLEAVECCQLGTNENCTACGVPCPPGSNCTYNPREDDGYYCSS
jgi:hypothetical protein